MLANLALRRAAARANARFDDGDEDGARHGVLAALEDVRQATSVMTLHHLANTALRISEGPGTAMHEAALVCLRRARSISKGARKTPPWRWARESLAERLVEELGEGPDAALAAELRDVALELIAATSRARDPVAWAGAHQLLVEGCVATGDLRAAASAQRTVLEVRQRDRLPGHWNRAQVVANDRLALVRLLLDVAKEGDHAAAAEAIVLLEEGMAEDPEMDRIGLDALLVVAQRLRGP